MKTRKWFGLFLMLSALFWCASAGAATRPIAIPFDEGAAMPQFSESMPADRGQSLDEPGDIVDFSSALVAAGNYLKRFQADITEDNAGNGSGGSESPNDPDDGGWDWMLNWDTAPHFHSTAASPLNIYGATAQGLYYAYLATNDPTYWTALLDAANYMVAAGDNIRSGADVKFLMLFDDLYDTVVGPTSTYADAAKSKYDNRITNYGSATAFAEYIRDVRNSQGYGNGIIAWDIGIWAVCAQMLYDRYGGTYDQDADNIAEVLWQDSFNDSPGYFDVEEDAGYDPTWANRNYWWYTIGLTGLIDAFDATGVHTDEIPGLIQRLQDSQHSYGAFSDSYGANDDDADWQDTAYILMTLHNYNAATYATEIAYGAYWLAATQHSGGGWVYGSGYHYPEVGGECTAGISFGSAPDEVWVDDDWTSQDDVDAGLVWGYNAFGTIQDGIDAVSGSTVNVAAGTYTETVHVNKHVRIIGAGSGNDPLSNTIVTQTNAHVFYLEASGISASDPILFQDFRIEPVNRNGIEVHNLQNVAYFKMDNVVIDGDAPTIENLNGLRVASDASLSYVEIANCIFTSLDYGWYFAKGDFPTGGSNAHHFTVTSTEFTSNYFKGIYVEKLEEALFTDCSFLNNGSDPFWNDVWNAGVDINLKGAETYQNISFIRCDFMGNALGYKEGAALMIKGRGTGNDPSYAAYPATLDDVQIIDCKVTGNERGVRLGEPGKNNTTPTNVLVQGCALFGNVKTYIPSDGSAYGDLINQTTALDNASGNWWGSANPTWSSQLYGSVDYTPWMGLAGTNTNPGYDGDFSELWVDDNSPQTGTMGRIEEGLDMVDGSTVNLAPGTYEEQVHITMNDLQLIGSGVGNTTIQSPVTLPLYFGTNKPIVFVDGATGVGISNLTVDGFGRGNSNYRFVGIGFWNSGGSLTDVNVTGVRDTPFSGAQHGVGIYAYNNTAGPYTINVTDVFVDDYQKNAFALNGNDNLTANLLRVTTIGVGPTTVTAQNGIQLWGASGTITDCNVSGNAWIWVSGTHWSAAGCLLYGPGTVNVSNLTATNNQVSINFVDANGGATGGSIVSTSGTPDYISGIDVSNLGYAKGSRNRLVEPSPLLDPGSASSGNSGSLDDDQSVTISGVTMTGPGIASSFGVFAYSYDENLDVEISECTIHDYEYGIYSMEDGGTISSASFTANRLDNAVNAWDNAASHYWNANCWSDFADNSGYPTQYDIEDAGNADLNPNANDCGDVDVFGPDYVGCPESGCPGDMLYYTLDQDAMVAGRMWLTLSAGLVADWTSDPYVFTPGAGWDSNFQMGWAQRLTGNKVEINVFFSAGAGGSIGNPAFYIAAIPVKSVTGATCSQAVAGDSAYFYEGPGDPPVRRDLFLATKLITVDCEISGELTGLPGVGSCLAYGSAAQLGDAFTADVPRGDLDCNAPLDSIWLEVNGNFYTFVDAEISGDFNQVFPGLGTLDAATLWGWLNEGCNDLILHFRDTECNYGFVTLEDIGKDVTIPNLTVDFVDEPDCYNNEPASPQYGATLLGGDLDILGNVGTGSCIAQTGTLWFSYGANTYPVTPIALPVTTYPDAGTEADDLWAWMVSMVGGSAFGDYTFTVHAMDCAGNETTDDFTVCMDFVLPTNSFSEFDARPTGMGVWLKWTWDATNLVEARIFRSAYNAAEYPEYTTPVWNDFGDDANYVQNYYDAVSNWVLVATLTTSDLNSGGFGVTHGGPGESYWLYKDASWDVDSVDNEERDIYRFVTFVKDAGGNWSELSAYTQNTNADRSTNYWLGDVTMDTVDDPSGSSFAVEGDDLNLFSASYFKKVGSGAAANCDFGPETGFPGGENGVGKGIPMPDDTVNFWDLVPFSFNFYTTGYNTWVTQPGPTSPKLELNVDEQPVVQIRRLDNAEIAYGDEFAIVLDLAGNQTNVVKGVEAILEFDPGIVEFVSAVTGDLSVLDGQLFAVARTVEGSENTVGIAAAACGPISVLSGDATLAMITFRWKSETSAHAEFALPSVRMYDAYGTILNGSGTTLGIGAEGLAPLEFALYQNYPNPFNPSTTIRFDLRENIDVRITIHNVLGQEVRTLVAARMDAGQYRLNWDGRDNSGAPITSGLYFCRMTAGDFQAHRKMLVTR